MPWYLTTLRISQPLHFGDYGGLPLQILWSVFDLITIVVLGSGLYLWWKRRKVSLAARLDPRGQKEPAPEFAAVAAPTSRSAAP
jgi:uncharacterized iron-regulated membrane protein